MNCPQCGKAINEERKRGQARSFCSDSCRQAHYRKKKKMELEALKQEKLEAENSLYKIQIKLNAEKDWLQDRVKRPFKSFIKSQPRTSFTTKLLKNAGFPPAGSLSQYKQYLLSIQTTPDELMEFETLWKLQLLKV